MKRASDLLDYIDLTLKGTKVDMPIGNVQYKRSSDFELLEEGVHMSTLVDIVETTLPVYKGAPGEVRDGLKFIFGIPGEGEKQTQLWKTCSLSLHPRSVLFGLLTSMLGKKKLETIKNLGDEKLTEVLNSLIGKNFMVNISVDSYTHKATGEEREINRIVSVSPAPAGTVAKKPVETTSLEDDEIPF